MRNWDVAVFYYFTFMGLIMIGYIMEEVSNKCKAKRKKYLKKKRTIPQSAEPTAPFTQESRIIIIEEGVYLR